MALGITELALVLLIVAVFFGAGKLPQVCEALGHGIKQFREASKDLDDTRKEIEASVRGPDDTRR